MNKLRPSAARRLIVLLFAFAALASCTDMGAGSDPVETEGAFLFALPPALKPSEIKAKAAEDSPESDELATDGENNALPAKGEETALEPATQEPTGKSPVAPASPVEDAAADESALAEELSDGSPDALPAETEPLEEGLAVSRYSLYMVSALGFRQEEEIEPSEEPARVIAQAGRWKIVAIAEDIDGKEIATCELSGIDLSADEEKALSLEWQAP